MKKKVFRLNFFCSKKGKSWKKKGGGGGKGLQVITASHSEEGVCVDPTFQPWLFLQGGEERRRRKKHLEGAEVRHFFLLLRLCGWNTAGACHSSRCLYMVCTKVLQVCSFFPFWSGSFPTPPPLPPSWKQSCCSSSSRNPKHQIMNHARRSRRNEWRGRLPKFASNRGSSFHCGFLGGKEEVYYLCCLSFSVLWEEEGPPPQESERFSGKGDAKSKKWLWMRVGGWVTTQQTWRGSRHRRIITVTINTTFFAILADFQDIFASLFREIATIKI